jgi:hypothetical protein
MRRQSVSIAMAEADAMGPGVLVALTVESAPTAGVRLSGIAPATGEEG